MTIEVWIEYLLRFAHLVAGIAWIGSSFYFIWLDSAFSPPETPRRNVEGELFMVHGGFYYQVEKRKIFPGELPKVLHWFKWEATLTWVTGFLLFVVLYYLRGASLLIDPQVFALTQAQAIGLSLSILAVSWLVYDCIWHPSFERYKSLSALVSFIYFSGLIYWLPKVFSGRGAFILTGVIFGSLMLLNVWVRILPGQSKMVKDAEAGRMPDYSISLKSKTRSVHNTYFIFPVLFIMLSNHYPALYNHSLNWLFLILLGVSGALTRHAMVTRKPIERWTLLPAGIGLLALVYLSAVPPRSSVRLEVIPYDRVSSIFQQRCLSCHSSVNTDEVFKEAPKGAIFETQAQIRAMAEKIYANLESRVMPLGNKTQITEEERSILLDWFKQEGLVQKP